MTINSGLKQDDVEEIVKDLSQILSNNYVLYFKTLNFHWNMIDTRFYLLHTLLESQYRALAEAGDEFAERIRSLGKTPPSSMKEFLSLSTLSESPTDLSGHDMIKTLSEDHQLSAISMREYAQNADKKNDISTSDMLIAHMQQHEKTAWILDSHLERPLT